MSIESLSITGIRNLEQVSRLPVSKVNIFYGANGSGKTSILEAIYLLGMAKSFRSSGQKLETVISHDQNFCSVVAFLMDATKQRDTIGVSCYRHNTNEKNVRINGDRIKSFAALAEKLPLQLINSDSFRLLESPKLRRNFLDWGVFHSTPQFFSEWKKLQQLLRQRNAFLKSPNLSLSSDQLQMTWDQELANVSHLLDKYRDDYIEKVTPQLHEILDVLLDFDSTHISLGYYRGWDKNKPMLDELVASLKRDRILGYTQIGPHRADLRIKIDGYNIFDVLSRGQQKQFVSALKVLQGYSLLHLDTQNFKSCVYLIDDLPSESDQSHQIKICRFLEQLNCQLFITCIDPDFLASVWSQQTSVSVFHVKHGCIIPANQ